ncbi:hypothetical protein [Methylophaga sp. OBS3]|uniref:hypothetical protein n=1 Tax=Methylophaga sp. OBS3 TaxID=2991934 RepID=UPI00225184EE|nr:hypothetical protein [Methylophaga sp. OBS3]MCX4189163.1 hypothetical protein [Methylophaga sp. OBS3]
MNIIELVKTRLSAIRNKQLMVCEWDTHRISGTVFNRKGKTIGVVASAESDLIDPSDAFADVVHNLRQNGWEGRQVVVLTPSAMSTVVELPVSPKKPKPIPQMHELVRWEVEPLLMQHQSQWTLGQLMEARGLLTSEQVSEIQNAQKKAAQAIGGVRPDRNSLKRFGDLAFDMGYVTQEQVQSLFVLQEWLRGEEDVVQCGWSAQGEVDDAPGVWNWLVTATYASSIQRWESLLASHHLSLIGLMPLTGNSVGLMRNNDKASLLIDVTAPITSVTKINKQHKVESVRYFINRSASMLEACLEVYHAENTHQHPAINLAASASQSSELATTFSAAIGHDVNLVPDQNIEQISPGALAAAHHVFKLKHGGRVSLIRPNGPLPPTWHRQEVQFASVLAGFLLIVFVAETVMFIDHRQVSIQKAEIDARAKVLDEAIARIKAQRAAIDVRKAKLAATQESQTRMEARLRFFGEQLPDRRLIVQAILGVLQNTVNEQIIVNRIDEMGRRVGIQPAAPQPNRPGMVELDNFNVDAWAVTESAAQEFVQNMKLAVAQWSMDVRDIQVMEKIGPMNMAGFSVSMSLIHVSAKPKEAL